MLGMKIPNSKLRVIVCSALIKDKSEILRKSTKAFNLKHSPGSSNLIQSLNGPLLRILANV